MESIPVKQELLDIVHPEETVESFSKHVEDDFHSQQTELWLILFSKMLLNICSVYNLPSPFTLTFKELGCSNSVPLVVNDGRKLKNSFVADWFVDLFTRELETFQKLPNFLHTISMDLQHFSGEQMEALLATLETMAKATRPSAFHLSNN